MRFLIIGGTLFVGRALTQAALAKGHHVTLLNRGKTAAKLPAGVEHLQADRNGDLSVLAGKSWDAVIDTCAYFPRQVRSLLAVLPADAHYTLISTASVYANLGVDGVDETAPLSAPLGDDVQKVDRETYGPLKSGCEMAAAEMAADRSLIIRPGIIVGPHDPTGRFAYWVKRMSARDTFIAPGDGSAPLQVIDVRDLAAWTLRLVEHKMTGAFNAVGPALPLKFGEFIQIGLHATGSRALPKWVSEATLTEHKIEGGSMLPLWVPADGGKFSGLFKVDGRKAWMNGLQLRGLDETIRDVAAYEAKLAAPAKVGMTIEDERNLLAKISAN